VVYVSERLMATVRLGGATGGKWGILDGKDESGLISDSELHGGSPRLCRLRTMSVVPATRIELCTDAYGIYGVPQT
jgi:hypothetical protein